MTRADLDKNPADVAAMFDDVAKRYDITNDVLSLGQDRRWRTAVTDAVAPRPGELVLDLAAGNGQREGVRAGRRHPVAAVRRAWSATGALSAAPDRPLRITKADRTSVEVAAVTLMARPPSGGRPRGPCC